MIRLAGPFQFHPNAALPLVHSPNRTLTNPTPISPTFLSSIFHFHNNTANPFTRIIIIINNNNNNNNNNNIWHLKLKMIIIHTNENQLKMNEIPKWYQYKLIWYLIYLMYIILKSLSNYIFELKWKLNINEWKFWMIIIEMNIILKSLRNQFICIEI